MFLMMRRIVEKSSTVRIFMFWSIIVCCLLPVFAPLPAPRSFLEEHFELAAEMKNGLRMNLGDTRFCDVQDLPDLLHGEFLIVVQRNHYFFLVRQVVDRLGNDCFETTRLDELRWALGFIRGHQIQQVEGLAIGGVQPWRFEAQQRRASDLIKPLVEFLECDAQKFYDFLVAGRTP